MRFLSIILICLLGSCSPKIAEQDLSNLNGYWEITEVVFTNGQTKEFMPSATIDYLELDGLKGFRKKVNPKLDGTFETSNDAKLFEISKLDDVYNILYAQQKGQEESSFEQLVTLSIDNFSVKDKEGTVYRYKRYVPISITP